MYCEVWHKRSAEVLDVFNLFEQNVPCLNIGL
jgi:hypothetical protein